MPVQRREQRGQQHPVVDLVVALDQQPAAHARREHRLQLAGLTAAEPLRLQVQGTLELVQVGEHRPVVGVEGHGQRPGLAVAGVEAAGRFAHLGEDAYGKARVGLSISSTVDRRDFGLNWQAELPSGGEVLDYAVTINVELELIGEEA